ncbi:MAG: HEPN domain-containing protein [Bacteroides sp.]|nr:HEPN domain-containing protein [Bacteroides sp.]MBD5419331.1 HEPN domain-containing protein [Bacteroides sp.]
MTLKSEERNTIVAYRLEKANSTIQQVKDIGNLGYWSLAASRLYYAVYYACVALLIHNGIEASTHRGVIRMVGDKFVRTGILTPDDSKLIGRLFTMRQTGDYDDLYDWEESDVTPLIPKAEEFVMRISNLIHTK